MSGLCLRIACLAAVLLAPLATLGAPVAPFEIAFGSPCEQIRQRLGNPSPRPPPPGAISRYSQVFEVSAPETFFAKARAIEVGCIKGKFSRLSIKVDRDGPDDELLRQVIGELSRTYGQEIVLRDSTADVDLGDSMLHVYVTTDWFGLFFISTSVGD